MQPTIYVMVGYPGSGKTTTSKIIAELTGAEHLWTDHERRKLFSHPTHSQFESAELYHRLNNYTEHLLENGVSVIYDTSFNFRRDRDHMRAIAAKYGAKVVVVCVDTPKELAKSRALHLDHAAHNKYDEAMSPEVFDRIADHVSIPGADEQPVVLDGTKITPQYVEEKLGL